MSSGVGPGDFRRTLPNSKILILGFLEIREEENLKWVLHTGMGAGYSGDPTVSREAEKDIPQCPHLRMLTDVQRSTALTWK